MRKFYIDLGDDEWIDLQKCKVIFRNPNGLGLGTDREYEETEAGFFAVMDENTVQPNVTGELVIVQDDYTMYQKLVDKLERAQELRLGYRPTDFRTLFMDIDIESMELSEMTQLGWLAVPVSFRGKTPYYLQTPQTHVIKSGSGAESVMRYTFRFPFRYTTNAAESSVRAFVAGHFSASIDAHINGPAANPILTARSVPSGNVLGVLDMTGVSMKAGEYILFSTRPNRECVWKVSGENRTELIDNVDISKKPFFKLPVRNEVEISLSLEVAPEVELLEHTVTINEFFRG